MRLLKIPLGTCKDAPEKIASQIPNSVINEAGMLKVITKENADISKIGKIDYFTLAIGGDSQITIPCFKAMSEDNSGIIIFSAQVPSYLKKLEEIVKPQNIVLVGTRAWTKEDFSYVKQKNIKYFSMKEMMLEGKEDTCDSLMSVANLWSSLYISININVLDPAFAPAVNNEEPGGMSSRELIYYIQRLKILKNLKMADLVEVNPQKEVLDTTIKTAVKIITELA